MIFMALPKEEEIAIQILKSIQDEKTYSRQEITRRVKMTLDLTNVKESSFSIQFSRVIYLLMGMELILKVEKGYYRITKKGCSFLQRQEKNNFLKEYVRQVKKNREIAEKIFKEANQQFIEQDKRCILMDVAEINWCARLAYFLQVEADKQKKVKYYADAEYNRNAEYDANQQEIYIKKAYINDRWEIVDITCDLIVHSRGENLQQDNLIAIEMKKSSRPEEEKQKDRERLKYMTRNSYNGEGTNSQEKLPRYICRYALGVYYEVDIGNRKIYLEYYKEGRKFKKEEINIM